MTDLPPPAPGPEPATAVPHTCEVCGRGPAMDIYASMYSGKILLGDELFWKGWACRECAICQYRAGLTHCLWAGWWAPVALVVNPRMIWRNLSGLRSAHRFAEPVGPPLAEPLDPGKPVLARPAAWAGLVIPVVVAALIVTVVLILTGGTRLDDLRTGDCIDLPEGTTIERADTADCDGPHDAEVTGTISYKNAAPGSRLCEKEIAAYLGTTGPVEGLEPIAIRYTDNGDVLMVCLIADADGKPLESRQRGAGR